MAARIPDHGHLVGLADGADPGGRYLDASTAPDEHLTWLVESSGCNEAPAWAARLAEEFGSLGALLAASPDRQRRAVCRNEAIVSQIGRFRAAMLHVLCTKVAERPVLAGSAEVRDYLVAQLSCETREQFRVLFLDGHNYLIRDQRVAQGTVDRAKVYARELFGRAIELGATGMILVHNHPGGDPRPSNEDLVLTRRLALLARPLDIELIDHLIVAAGHVVSLRAEGGFA